MNELFLRERLNIITGHDKYMQVHTVSPIPLVAGTDPNDDNQWININPMAYTTTGTILNNNSTVFHMRLIAYQLTLDEDGGDLANTKFRIIADNAGVVLDKKAKCFPFPAWVDILSGADEYLQYQLTIPPRYNFQLQIYSEFTTGNPTVNLDYLSLVRTDPYSYV